MNKIVEQVLRTMAVEVNHKWVEQLSYVEFAINSSTNASTNKTPFELVYGCNVRTVADQLDGLHRVEEAQQLATTITRLVNEAKAKLVEAQEMQAKYYNRKHKPIEFKVGDQVLLSTKYLGLTGTRKLQQRFVGPMKVIARVGQQAYRLQLPQALQQHHNVFHVSLLRQYIPGGDGVVEPQPIVVNGELEWEVEAILRHRLRRGVRQYLVKFLGYDLSESIWLDETELVNALDILQQYKTAHHLEGA